MARIINDLGSNASPALIRAAEASLQKPNQLVFRVTQLIDAPLIRTLMIRHWDELKMPVSKTISALHGTSWHMLMERHAPESSIVEERITIGSGTFGEYEISGQPDEIAIDPLTGLYSIIDHKTTKTYKYIEKAFGHWEQQLNVYALMKSLQNIQITSLYVYMAFTDWSKYKMFSGGDDYPPRRALRETMPLWTREQQAEFVGERMEDHLENPERTCTAEEMWKRETTYALKKTGRKTALKVEPSIGGLHDWAAKHKKPLDISSAPYSIETRPGACVRCEDWCEVSDFCPFWREQCSK